MWHNTINQYQIPTVGYCIAYNTNAKWCVIWQNLAALIKKGTIFTFTKRKFNGSQRQCRINKKNPEAIYDFLLFLENVKDWLSSKLLSMNRWTLSNAYGPCTLPKIFWKSKWQHVILNISHDPPDIYITQDPLLNYTWSTQSFPLLLTIKSWDRKQHVIFFLHKKRLNLRNEIIFHSSSAKN